MAAKVGQVIVDFLLNTAKFESDIKKVSKTFKQVGRDLSTTGKELTKSVTLPLVAAGAAVIKFANDFDEGMDKIRSGTGATGKALASLGDSMQNVMKGVPQGVTDVSTAITDLNARLGLTGKPLEEMTTQMLNLARITGTELKPLIETATQLFAKWSVDTAKQSQALDYLYKVSQTTGVGIQRLADLTVQFATPLKGIGLDLENAAAMMAQWEKEGVNVEQAVMGLTKSMSAFAKAGLEPAQALKQMEASIKGAKSETEAMAIAVKIFGTRAGPELAKAIREGRFSIEELVAKVKASSDTINKAAADTMSFGEKMGILGNKIAIAAKPLGDALLQAFDRLMPYIEKAIVFVADLIEKFASLPAPIQGAIITLGAIAAAAGPVLMIMGSMATTIGKLIPIFVSVAGSIAKFIQGMGGLSTALVSATGGITMFGQVAVGLGAFWLGWELGKLLNHLSWVNAAGNKLAEWIVKIPGIMPSATAATANLGASTQLLSDKLKSFGVNVDRMANESIPAWADRVQKAAAEYKKLHPELSTTVTKTGELTAATKSGAAAFDMSALSMGGAKSEAQKLREETAKLLVISKEMDSVQLHEFWNAVESGMSDANKELEKYRKTQEETTNDLKRYTMPTLDTLKYKIDRDIKQSWKDLGLTVEDTQFKIDESTIYALADMARWSEGGQALEDKWKKEFGGMEKSTNELGNVVSTTLTNMTQEMADRLTQWAGKFQGFAKAALSSLMEGLFNPVMKWLTGIGNSIGNWLGGLLGGKGGGFSLGNLFGGGNILGSLFGAGGGGAATATNAATGFMGPMLGGGGAAAGGAGGAAAGGGSFMGSMGAFFTNPWTIGIGAAAGLGYLGYKFAKGPNSWQAGSEEALRDFKVELSDDTFQKLVESWGKQEDQIWDIRKDLLSAPQTLVNVLAPLAEQQGKMGAFLTSLEKVQTAWGTYNFRTPLEQGMQTGDFSALNDIYVKAFSVSESLQKAMPDWQSKLLMVESATQASTDALLGSVTVMDQNTIAITGNTDAIQKLIGQLTAANYPGLTIGGDQAAVPALASGTNYVPQDMLAYLHRGEQVIPAGENGTRNITIRNGDISLHFTINGGGDDLVQTIKNKVIPILKREMRGGNSGLAEAMVKAYDRTAKAF